MALRGNAPRGDRVTTSGLVLALAAAVRVVDRVHDGTADAGADALPAVTACLTPVDVGLLSVANFTNGCAAANIHVADFSGGQTELTVETGLRVAETVIVGAVPDTYLTLNGAA